MKTNVPIGKTLRLEPTWKPNASNSKTHTVIVVDFAQSLLRKRPMCRFVSSLAFSLELLNLIGFVVVVILEFGPKLAQFTGVEVSGRTSVHTIDHPLIAHQQDNCKPRQTGRETTIDQFVCSSRCLLNCSILSDFFRTRNRRRDQKTEPNNETPFYVFLLFYIENCFVQFFHHKLG